MTARDNARAVLDAAEAKLKEIVKEALSRGDYADVATIAATAQSISDLRHSLEGMDGIEKPNMSIPENATSIPNDVADSRPDANVHRMRQKLDYPRFQRQAKRLVKLGWSSKDGRIYE